MQIVLDFFCKTVICVEPRKSDGKTIKINIIKRLDCNRKRKSILKPEKIKWNGMEYMFEMRNV
jgi:hypothetical protein